MYRINEEVSTTMKYARRVFLFVLLIALLIPLGASAQVSKVEVCHIPGNDPAKARTLEISANALDAHLAHGDIPGPCPVDANGDLACIAENGPGVFAFHDIPDRIFDPLNIYTTNVHSLWNDPVFAGATAQLKYWTMGGHWIQHFTSPTGEMTGWRAIALNCIECGAPAMHLFIENAVGQRALIGPSASPPEYDINVVYESVAYTPDDSACGVYPGGLMLAYNHANHYWELDGSRVVKDSNFGILVNQ